MKKYMLVLVLLLISACSQLDRTQTDSPKMQINYQGDKYIFNEVYAREEINMEDITSTNTFTAKGDVVMFGKEIFLDQKSGDLFIIADSGPKEEWVRFTKIENN